jgi:hypothetical protein
MSDRLELVAAVRGVIVANLQPGFEELVHYKNMQTWAVPDDLSPHKDGPLPVIALGERKSYVSLYVIALHWVPGLRTWLDAAWRDAGQRLDRGKVAIRLRSLDETPLDVIAECISRVTVDDVVAGYLEVMSR